MDEFSPKLPHIECMYQPACSTEISCHFSAFLKCSNFDLEPFGYGRKIDLQRFEGLIFYHQLRKLNSIYAWKETYTNINYFCNNDRILWKKLK